ncbi:hypothetical protein BGZ68_000760 [Mortierella alpina]|nr:hypothetical protein BGZ68_000760 [Mortierella alpina]
MKFITVAITILAVALATAQAAPAFHKRDGGSLVNVEDVKVPVYVKVEDVANHLADHAKILSRALLKNTDIVKDNDILKEVNVLKDSPYHAKAPIKEGLQAGAIGAGVGLLVSAVQNSVGTHSHGATGVFARTGGTIGVFAAMAGVFAATDSAVSNVRETKDAWNSVAAGCASGLVAGGFQRNAQTMVFGCGKYADMTEQQKQEWRQSQLNTK